MVLDRTAEDKAKAGALAVVVGIGSAAELSDRIVALRVG